MSNNYELTVTGIRKKYIGKGLTLEIDLSNGITFTINITDDMRKLIAYHLNDVIQMNVKHEDVKHLLKC